MLDFSHVIADANKRLDVSRRLEQKTKGKRVSIPKRIFLVGQEKLGENERQKIGNLLERYPNLKGFYRAKEALQTYYQKDDRAVATRPQDNMILNLKAGEDGELIRLGNTLKRWRAHLEPL